MRRLHLWMLPAVLGLFAMGGSAQQFAEFDDADQTRDALRQALADRAAAEQRSNRLEAEAEAADNEADKASRGAAALAARIQQAEAGIAAAQAQMELIEDRRQQLREELGREQRPVIELTAALQQFSRRPLTLSVLRPGSVKDVVYLRALLSSAVPEVQDRTSDLRGRIARSRELQVEAGETAATLRAEEVQLNEGRKRLNAMETRHRLASRQAGGDATREAERALALAERARDLDGLVGELDRAGELRRRLAALPGPVLRPASPETAQVIDEGPADVQAADGSLSSSAPPAPYVLPVTGKVVAGFGAPISIGYSQGVTFAPRENAVVVAPAAGRVAFAGPYRGYGRIVIIEHAGGWTSLITGLARIDVRIGEDLVGAAPLGVAGADRPSVTLELRRGADPINPLLHAR